MKAGKGTEKNIRDNGKTTKLKERENMSMSKGTSTTANFTTVNVMAQVHTHIKTAINTRASGNHNKNKATEEYQCFQAISIRDNGVKMQKMDKVNIISQMATDIWDHLCKGCAKGKEDTGGKMEVGMKGIGKPIGCMVLERMLELMGI